MEESGRAVRVAAIADVLPPIEPRSGGVMTDTAS